MKDTPTDTSLCYPFVNNYLNKIDVIINSGKSSPLLYKEFLSLKNELLNDKFAQKYIAKEMKDFLSQIISNYITKYENYSLKGKVKRFVGNILLTFSNFK